MMRKDILKDKDEIPVEIKRVIIISVVILIVLVGIYFLTEVILNKEDDDSDKVTENAIQYEEILAGESFNQIEDKYYVIYYDSTDDYSSISSLISSYQMNDNEVKLYSVDLSNGMNKAYITDGNVVTTNANSLRVKANTLLEFTNKKVTDVITDNDEIIDILNS